MPAEKLRTSRLALLLVGLPVLLYLAALFVLPVDGFWINDNGCKFIQVQALERNGFRDFAIPWSGQELDPELRYNPLPAPFGYVIDGHLYGTFSAPFVLLSAGAHHLFGRTGLFLLPLLGGLLTLAGVWRLAGLLPGTPSARPVAVFLVALATPLWFYSVTFWEHTPAVCLTTWSVACVLGAGPRGRGSGLILGGLLCGFAVYFRDELYLFAAVLACVTLLRDRGRIAAPAMFVGGLLVALLPLWLFQAHTLGHLLGLHAAMQVPWAHGLGVFLEQRWSVFRVVLLNCHAQTWASLGCGGGFLLLLAWYPRVSRERASALVPLLAGLAALAGAVVLAGHLASPQPIRYLLTANGLFAVSPILVLALLRVRSSASDPAGGDSALDAAVSTQRLLWLIVVLYAAAYVLLTPRQSAGGIHWGCRYLLPLYPLLGGLAATTLSQWWRGEQRRRAGHLAVIGAALVLSVTLQLYSVGLAYQRKRFCADLNQLVARRPEQTIIAFSWFLPQELSSNFFSKRIFLSPSQADTQELLARLQVAGTREVLLVVSPPHPDVNLPNGMLLEDSLNSISVALYPIPLSGAPGE